MMWRATGVIAIGRIVIGGGGRRDGYGSCGKDGSKHCDGGSHRVILTYAGTKFSLLERIATAHDRLASYARS
jgi:hypothetical protein